MRDGQIMVSRMLRWRQIARELSQAKRREDGHYVGIMAKIKIQTLVEWKGDGVIVECGVDLRARVTQSVVFKSSYDFLYIA